MKLTNTSYIIPLIVILLFSCTKEEIVQIENPEKELVEISTWINENLYQGTIDQNAKSIAFTIPYYFRFFRESLNFDYKIVGSAISPDLSQTADYTSPQQVTVSAADNSKVTYTLSVDLLPQYEINLDIDKTTYSQSDSLYVKGINLGNATRVCLVTCDDINSIDPFSGLPSLQPNILSDKIVLRDTVLAIPMNELPKSIYRVVIKFPDTDEVFKLNQLITVE